MIDHKIKKFKLDSHEDCRVKAAPTSIRDDPPHSAYKKEKRKKNHKNPSSAHYKKEPRSNLIQSPPIMPLANHFTQFSFTRTITPQMSTLTSMPPMSPLSPLSPVPHLTRMLLAGHSSFVLNPFALIPQIKLPRFHFSRLPFMNAFHSNTMWTTFFYKTSSKLDIINFNTAKKLEPKSFTYIIRILVLKALINAKTQK